MKYPDNTEEQRKNFLFVPDYKTINPDVFTENRKKSQSDTYIQTKKFLFDCSDKKI